jgi:Cdc6-like AAA superfamily ATPase
MYHFDQYISKMEKTNLHPKIKKIIKTFPENIENFNNIIVYGPSSSGKYSQALNIISRYSPSKLKYEKRLTVNSKDHKDETYVLKMSDIHFEVDMFLLGCNSKILWYSIFQHISDIISMQKVKYGIILCKNFHLIQNELLDVFYSYIQQNFTQVKIHFILITEELSFIPNNIIDCCEILYIQKPYKSNILKCKKKNESTELQKNIIDSILKNTEKVNFVKLRNSLYDIFIFQLDVYYCLWVIYRKLNLKDLNTSFKYLLTFFHGYNNNYRHIYHIELLIHQLICK